MDRELAYGLTRRDPAGWPLTVAEAETLRAAITEAKARRRDKLAIAVILGVGAVASILLILGAYL